jgi:uncharacterized membrane protein YkvA (DUF1232 family)
MVRVHKLAAAAKRLKSETIAIYLATRDPRTPWLARIVAAVVVAYALSPIDLIPDFVPILGYLDDLILLPLGLALAVRLIPPPVMVESRERAAVLAERPISRAGAVAIAAVWLVLAALVAWWLASALRLV